MSERMEMLRRGDGSCPKTGSESLKRKFGGVKCKKRVK